MSDAVSDEQSAIRKSSRASKPTQKILEKEPTSTRASRRKEAKLKVAEQAPSSAAAVDPMEGVIHHDTCDACGDGGNLLCCDGCPRTFHFQCLDPPVDENELPDDVDWFCTICLSKKGMSKEPHRGRSRALGQVFKSLPHWNPLAFWMPQSYREDGEAGKYEKDPNPPHAGTPSALASSSSASSKPIQSKTQSAAKKKPRKQKPAKEKVTEVVAIAIEAEEAHSVEEIRSTNDAMDIDVVAEELSAQEPQSNSSSEEKSATPEFELPENLQEPPVRKDRASPYENEGILDQIIPREHHFAVELGRKTAEYMDMARLHYQERFRTFPSLDSEKRDEEMNNFEKEMHHLFEVATNGQNARDVTTGELFAGPQILNQMGGMFTQFLAWQRLMNLVGQVPEDSPLHKRDETRKRPRDDDNSSRTNGHNGDDDQDNDIDSQPPSKKVRVDSNEDGDQSFGRTSSGSTAPMSSSATAGLLSTPVHPNRPALDRTITPVSMPPPPPGMTPNISFTHRSLPGTPVTPSLPPTPPPIELPKPEGEKEEALHEPPPYSLVPKDLPTHALISGQGIWGEKFTHHLRSTSSGFFIGRKNPQMDIDLSEYTDVRTISHKHCGFFYNSKLGRFEVENYGRNGTRLNGEVFGKTGSRRKPLKDGDEIEVGRVKIKFTLIKKEDEEK